MKVLVVHNYYQQRAGEGAAFEQECRLLARYGHEVVRYSRTNDEIEKAGAWQRLRAPFDIVWNERSRREFLALLRRERPQVVHVHNTFFMISPSIFSACKEEGVPVVQTLHNYRLFCPVAVCFRQGRACEDCREHSLWRGIRHGCYHGSPAATAVVASMIAFNRRRGSWPGQVDAFIALTAFAARKVAQAGVPDERIVVKPNFVEPDPGEGSGPRDYALFVGRLSPEKGAAAMLQAWRTLRDAVPLQIAGAGPEQQALKEQAQRDGLSNVQFLGRLPRSETLAKIQGARFLVFPSEWYEGFPVTICEAFACGTPVICARLGAMEEVVEHGRTGLHYTTGNTAELAERVEWAWAHPGEMRQMGRQARRDFEARYTPERNYGQLMDIYERVIAGKRGAPTLAAAR